MEVHVIRHTPVDVAKDICYGRLNVDVADTFINDAKSISEKLDAHYDAIYTSPSLRCQKLCKELSLPTPLSDERLLELNFGEWEGRSWKEINQKELDAWMSDFVSIAPYKGESLLSMSTRVSEFLSEIREKKFESILIVTHAGVIRCIWAYLLNIPLENIFKIPVGFHELFTFNLGKTKDFDQIKRKK